MTLNNPFNFKTIKKAGAALFLFIGVPIVLVSMMSLFDPSAGVRQLSLVVLSFVGVPPTAIGGWLLWDVRQQTQRERLEVEQLRRDRLNATFFRMITDADGAITPLQFSMATQLPGDEAKEFLDRRAKDFDAAFDVTADGNLIYRFDIHMKQIAGQSQEFLG